MLAGTPPPAAGSPNARSPLLREQNPPLDSPLHRQVPVWEEDSGKFRFYESRAILKHVTAGSELYPADDPRLVAKIEQWVSVEYSYFGELSPAAVSLRWPRH